jgi:hypothetical protein
MVTWIDEQRGAPPLLLTDTLVVIRNGLRHHDLRIDATPQLAWGERFSARVRMNQSLVDRAGDWRRWRGTLHAELPHVDVALLRSYVDLPSVHEVAALCVPGSMCEGQVAARPDLRAARRRIAPSRRCSRCSSSI